MLLTITTTRRPANDLGYLLHKHTERFQSFDLSFGKAHVYYPEAADERCTACLLLDVDPVGVVRGKSIGQRFLLDVHHWRPKIFRLILRSCARSNQRQQGRKHSNLDRNSHVNLSLSGGASPGVNSRRKST